MFFNIKKCAFPKFQVTLPHQEKTERNQLH